MFESFVIMLREGIEAALVIGITLVVLKRSARRDLERAVYGGLGLAIVASVVAAVALNALTISEEVYEGVLYWVSAVFVASMMWWMHRKAKSLHAEIEQRVQHAVETAGSAKEAWGLGAFAFLMVFREGAEAVMFLSAVNLTTDALLSFIGALVGLAAAILFCVMFVRGSLQVNLGRFFTVTTWVLGIFVVQLLVNGYHEFSEIGIVPATRQTMALVGPVVRNNSLFLLAIVAIPLFILLSRTREAIPAVEGASAADMRLARARVKRERFYRLGAVVCALLVLVVVGVAYAREMLPKEVPPPEPAAREGDGVVVPLQKLEDGKLHRFGFLTGGHMVRFLAMKASDGKVRTALDACEICGASGYIQDGENLLCLNCGAEINPRTLGEPGGCNPVPLEAQTTATHVRVPVAGLTKAAGLFTEQPGIEATCPVCGMRVKMKEASAFETQNGKTYYFCKMERCRAMFRENPRAYVR